MEVQFRTFKLEKIKYRAARFVTGNYVFEIGGKNGILGENKMGIS